MHPKSNHHLELTQMRLEPGAHWTPASPGLQFVFPIQGAAEYVTSAFPLPLGPGDVLVRNGTAHGRILSSLRTFVFFTFSMCLQHLVPLLTAGEVSMLDSLTERLGNDRILRASTRQAVEAHRLITETPERTGLESRSHLLRIASVVLADEFHSLLGLPQGLTPIEKQVLQTYEKLSIEEIIDLPVGELAARLGCSRRHLNRLFQEHLNLSASSLKMELRLLKAVSLLRDRNAKVIDVAIECGFNHLGLFNNCFRKRFGMSPTEWRKGGNDPTNPGPTTGAVGLPAD